MITRLLFALVGTVMLGSGAAFPADSSRKPNFVFILVDDMGWADIGANGSSFYRTPNIDSLAKDGIRFTDAYAACPVCSPTRAAIMTGKYPARLHLTDWLPGRGDRPDQKLSAPKIRPALPLEETTIAEALKPAGYVSAHVGKWHLGGEGFGPLEQGFDVNIAGDHTGTPLSYFAPFERNGRFMPGLEQAPEGEYLTDRLTDEALKFIEANRERPFFLHFSHYTVHIPLKAKPGLIDANLQRDAAGPQTNAVYAAMIDSLDESVGRVLGKLEELGLAEDTMVIFTSDNGGLATLEGPFTPATSNAPLRNGKGYLQEGGIREPLFIKWPRGIKAGRVEHMPVSSIDFFPTILGLAGAPLPGAVDGVDLSSVLKGTGQAPVRSLYWHYPHYANQARSSGAPVGGGPGAAMRDGRWKLIQHFESGRHELYDLTADIGEGNNLAAAMPEKVLEMGKQLHAWQNSVKAQWPRQFNEWKNPPVQAPAAGDIVLHSRGAFVHGEKLQYEPQPHKDTLGYWTIKDDWAHWDFELVRSGRYRVEALQGCGKGSGGAEVEFGFSDTSVTMTVQDTGHFQNFIWRELGEVQLQAGRQTMTLKAKTKPGAAVMDLREVRLVRLD
ncbi:MAG TPA: N-acetylgalactosamine 6-sulfate sulfatase (GALNS) [Verrucomicrobiales bacterium]|nr:N-acetylgalactosamine 6-sulfate sulfatase (GALNS) [Verrucomicrobiales bacterium]